jgi:hypothetical protein
MKQLAADQGCLDEGFNVMVNKLLECQDAPDWFQKYQDHMLHWRSHSRLISLFRAWSARRWGGDAKLYEELLEWVDYTVRESNRIASTRRRLLAFRLDKYRNFAAALRRQYGSVVLEKIDWRAFQKRADAEDDETSSNNMRRQQNMAAPGELSTVLQQSRMKVIMVNPANTTKRCHLCGHINQYDAAASIKLMCNDCQAVFDQDVNAAQNLLDDGHNPLKHVIAKPRKPKKRRTKAANKEVATDGV